MNITRTIKFHHILIVFIAMGFTSMISQVILLRELVLFFTGNELTLGIILAIWLLGTALGSGLLGRAIKFSGSPGNLLIISQFILVILLPLTIIFIRLSNTIFSIPTGEITSPIFILLIPLLALAPICIIVGFLYTLGCKLLSQFHQQDDSSIPGRVFLFEAIGAGIAGFIASIFLFRFLENFQIAAIVCIINLAVAIFLWIIIKQKLLPLFFALAVISVVLMIILFPRLDDFSNQKMWGNFELIHSETTIYGNVAVTRLAESISFYENGVLMFTHPDLMSAEESVHFALLEHPEPRKVLLIGGNAAGSLPQVLSHPGIETVDFVLLDPVTIHLTRQLLPDAKEILKDERVKIWYQDGRIFLNQTNLKYDVVIVNLPDPQTAMINRFFTLEFYQSIKEHLDPGGILSFSVSSSENVLSDEQTILLNCLYRTMAQSFKDIVLIPGNAIHFIGCLSTNILTKNPELLVQRLKQRNLPTVYVQDYYIPFRMTKDRMDYVVKKVTTDQVEIINRDFRPIGYFFNIILWLTYFDVDLQVTTKFLNQANISSIIIALFLVASLFIMGTHLAVKKHGSIKPAILLTIMTIGFSAISLEVLIILGFQAIYGYAYYQLALIMSGFMIGLMLGSWYSLQAIDAQQTGFKNFVSFQIILTGYPLITAIVLSILSKHTLPAMVIQVIFLVLIALAGLIGGYQFPLANYLIFQGHERIERIGGLLYAYDLLGSVFGALLTSTLLIPILGLSLTCLVFSLLNFGVTIMLLLSKKHIALARA